MPLNFAQPILEWLHEHQIVHTVEPSLKLAAGRLDSARRLFGLRKSQLGPDADRLLAELCVRMEMPDDLLGDYLRELHGTGYVLFGFECDAEQPRYKAYLDYSSRAACEIGQDGSQRMFLGYKWTPDGAAVTTEYRCYRSLSRRGMLHRSRALLEACTPALAVIEAAFAACARDWPDRPLYYMEAREAGNPRASFDIKFYSTSMGLASLRPELHVLGDRLGIAEAVQEWLEANGHTRLGHLSGGLDRSGAPFLTVYHGVQRGVIGAGRTAV